MYYCIQTYRYILYCLYKPTDINGMNNFIYIEAPIEGLYCMTVPVNVYISILIKIYK